MHSASKSTLPYGTEVLARSFYSFAAAAMIPAGKAIMHITLLSEWLNQVSASSTFT